MCRVDLSYHLQCHGFAVAHVHSRFAEVALYIRVRSAPHCREAEPVGFQRNCENLADWSGLADAVESFQEFEKDHVGVSRFCS